MAESARQPYPQGFSPTPQSMKPGRGIGFCRQLRANDGGVSLISRENSILLLLLKSVVHQGHDDPARAIGPCDGIPFCEIKGWIVLHARSHLDESGQVTSAAVVTFPDLSLCRE